MLDRRSSMDPHRNRMAQFLATLHQCSMFKQMVVILEIRNSYDAIEVGSKKQKMNKLQIKTKNCEVEDAKKYLLTRTSPSYSIFGQRRSNCLENH